jgi:hypothetical protein
MARRRNAPRVGICWTGRRPSASWSPETRIVRETLKTRLRLLVQAPLERIAGQRQTPRICGSEISGNSFKITSFRRAVQSTAGRAHPNIVTGHHQAFSRVAQMPAWLRPWSYPGLPLAVHAPRHRRAAADGSLTRFFAPTTRKSWGRISYPIMACWRRALSNSKSLLEVFAAAPRPIGFARSENPCAPVRGTIERPVST